jgi:serine/threonine protein phosphatase PrpC
VRFRPGSAWSERDDARRRNQQRLSTGSNASAASVEKVLEACEETARAVASPNAEGRRIQRLFDDVCGVRKGTKALDALALRLKADETLLRARATRCGPKVYDGASVLHAAAFHGQLHVIEAVLAIEESPLDPWTLDTAGRTALHVAAERGHVGCCDALRKAMSASQDDPVGENAPMDMSGRTPCAWAAERVKDAQKRDALEATLFSPGDATVLPRRSEKSHAAHAVSSTAGWRVVMEDAHCVCRLDGATLYAVFDGHGGSLVANYAAANIERCLQLSEDPAASLKNALATLDAELEQHPRLVKSRRSGRGGTGPLVAEDESGATALLCLVTRTEVVVAHLGDSRGALLRKQGGKWSSQDLTPADHTAGSPAEAARIDSLQNFGVLRRENDAPRVARKVDGAVVENGALQTTRALGDFVFKTATERAVTCEADARALSLQECRGGERSCVLLACDGLWDVLTGEECGAILDSCVEGLDAQCDALVAECVRRRSRDNVTAILVDLDASAAAKALAFGGGTP